MNSMTGHGRGEFASGGLRVVTECFSVNRKQGEVGLACAREYAWLEPHVREEVLKRVARGKVQVAITVEHSGSAASHLIDQTRAAAFLAEARALSKKLGLSGEVDLATVLAAPGVLKSDTEVDKEIWPQVKKALGIALDAMLEMRGREGAHLQKELGRGATRLQSLVKKVKTLAPRVPKRQRENLLKRLETANLPLDLLDPRVATEIAVFAERCDVSEELARLDSHLIQFRDALTTEGSVGRTLEFLAQEMGREWNTTGAKASDAEISRLVVDAKSELDKLREQLANIE